MDVKLAISVFAAFACVALFVNAKEYEVIVGPGLTFDPKELEINVDDTVVFRWAFPETGATYPGQSIGNKVPHTVTKSISFEEKCKYVDDKEKKEKDIFHSGYQESGYVFKHKFTEVEDVTYHCETTGKTCTNCQGGMWGRVFVKESGAEPKKPSKKYKMEDDSPGNKETDDAAAKAREGTAKIFG